MTNVTGWSYDVQGRLTTKTYPDISTVVYAYETTTSRLKSVMKSMVKGTTKRGPASEHNKIKKWIDRGCE